MSSVLAYFPYLTKKMACQLLELSEAALLAA